MSCKSCSPDLTVGPTPHYTTIENSTIQNHTQVFNDSCYPLGVPVEEQWVIPAEGSEVTLKINNLKDVPLGAYLYNPFYGYFKISHWNPSLNNVGVINDGVRGTQAAGTSVPAGTVFSVADRPCCEDDATTVLPFVAEDFIAPNVSATRQIKVTSTFGLQVGDIVRIATGTYTVTAISTIGFIVILNEGDGVSPGTEIVALDSVGDYQYLITRDIPNPCESEVLNSQGALVTCNGRFSALLQGSYAGSVPAKVSNSSASFDVSFRLLDAFDSSVYVSTAAASVTAGDGGVEFLVNPSPPPNQANINLGDIVYLPYTTESSLRFVVTDASAPVLSLDLVPGYGTMPTTKTYPSGTVIRKVPASEYLHISQPWIQTLGAGGTANAHVVSFGNYYAGQYRKLRSNPLPKGMRITVVPFATNTASVTLDPGHGSPCSIGIVNSVGTVRPLLGGELPAGIPYTVESDGSGNFILVDYTPRYRIVQTANLSHLSDLTINTCDTTFEYKNNGADLDIHILLDSLNLASSSFMDSISFNINILLGLTSPINADYGRILPGEYLNPSGGSYVYGRTPDNNRVQLVREGFANFAVGASQRIMVSGKVKR